LETPTTTDSINQGEGTLSYHSAASSLPNSIHSKHSKASAKGKLNSPSHSNELVATTTGDPPPYTPTLQIDQQFSDPSASVHLQHPLIPIPDEGVWTPTKTEMEHEMKEGLDFIKRCNYQGAILYTFSAFVVDPELSHPENSMDAIDP
jgi:hypothetical protein